MGGAVGGPAKSQTLVQMFLEEFPLIIQLGLPKSGTTSLQNMMQSVYSRAKSSKKYRGAAASLKKLKSCQCILYQELFKAC